MDQVSFLVMLQYYVQLVTFGSLWMMPFVM